MESERPDRSDPAGPPGSVACDRRLPGRGRGARSTSNGLADAATASAALARLARFARHDSAFSCSDAGLPIPLADVVARRPAWVILADRTAAGPRRPFASAGVEVLVEAVTWPRPIAARLRGRRHHPEGARGRRPGRGGHVVRPDPEVAAVGHGRRPGVPAVLGPRRGRAEHRGGVPGRRGRGVVLDSQVLLARESPVSDDLRKRTRRRATAAKRPSSASGSAKAYRVYSRADSPAAQELADEEERLLAADLSTAERLDRVAGGRPRRGSAATRRPGSGWSGRTSAAAAGLAAKVVTVAGIVQAIARAGDEASWQRARRLRPLAEGVAAGEVARHALPDPAGADDPGQRHGRVRRRGRRRRGAAVPGPGPAAQGRGREAARRDEGDSSATGRGASASSASSRRRSATEQLEAVRAVQAAVRHHRRRPAGPGAGAREATGIATYLHVPSPGLLRMFLKDGARRFIFEGRECGGHVGPRTSFVLWEAMVEVLAEHVAAAPGGRPARRLRRRHPRRPVGGDGRGPGRRAGRAGREGRRAARHRLPVHAGGRRGRGDRRAVPAGSAGLRRHGAAGDRPRPRHPLRPDALRRRPSRPRSGGCAAEGKSPAGSRAWRWSG